MDKYNDVNEYDNDDIADIDSSWITNFDNMDNEYKIYYCDHITFINFLFIYINDTNEIEKLKEEKLLLKENGKIQKEEFISMIKHNQINNNMKYYLSSMSVFNINIEPTNLKSFLRSKDKTIGNNFLTTINNVDTLRLDKSISMFHDLNSVIVLLRKKNNKQTNKSKKNFQNSYTHNRTRKTA